MFTYKMNGILGRWNSHRGLVRFGVAALPVVGYHFNKLRFLWPPIGSTSVYGAYFVALLAWLLSLTPVRMRSQTRAKAWMCVGLMIVTCSMIWYASLLSKYVIAVETPHDGTQYRTIGSARTLAASELERSTANLSDERLLQRAGLTDAAIKQMWTAVSVDRVRLELFLAILLLWSSANFTASCFARATFDPSSRQ